MVVRQEPLYLVYINLGHKFSVIYTCNYLLLHLDSKGLCTIGSTIATHKTNLTKRTYLFASQIALAIIHATA